MDSTVVIEPAYNALSDVRALFEAYTAMLVTHDPAFQIYLDIQHYADELRAPPPSTPRRMDGCTWPGWTGGRRAVSPCGGWTASGAK